MGAANDAQVTLDVLHSGIIWGWLVTMNFWAKSISTGVFLLGAFFMKQEGPSRRFYRLVVPAIGFVFVNITLLFTVLDLHQIFRFWHMFVWPHPTSAINLGAWVLTAYTGLTALLTWLAWKKNDALYDRLIVPTWIIAFLATIYTAALLGQANARELWHTPTEVAQMVLAATLAGSAVFLLVRGATEEQRTRFAWILGLSASLALVIFVAEVVFAPQKSEEAVFLDSRVDHREDRRALLLGPGVWLRAPGGPGVLRAVAKDRHALARRRRLEPRRLVAGETRVAARAAAHPALVRKP